MYMPLFWALNIAEALLLKLVNPTRNSSCAGSNPEESTCTSRGQQKNPVAPANTVSSLII